MGRDLTIFTLPKLPEAEALAAVRQTLDAEPLLKRIYDDAFIEQIVKRRTAENVLLLRLAQPNDELAMSFLAEVVADIEAIGVVHAIESFASKMRAMESEKIASWRTELWFAAWLARKGISVDFEPAVGSRVAEFHAQTNPPTWWEIKSPLDAAKARADEAVQLEVQKRLNSIPEPFSLWLESADLPLTDVVAAVREVRKQLADFAKTNGMLPRLFASRGLVVKATRRVEGPGHLMGMIGPGYMFQGEHAELATNRIIHAAAQLPPEGPGIVVIDCSNATWLDEDDVEDACYGEPTLVMRGSTPCEARRGGVFRPDKLTRVSAVIAYNPRFARHGKYDMAVYHNPFAKVPLPAEMFDYPDVRQGRVEIIDGRGVYKREDKD